MINLLELVKVLDSIGADINTQIHQFKTITKRSEKTFFKYQKILYKIICQEINKGIIHPLTTKTKKEFAYFVLTKYPKLKDACFYWMRYTKKSRSSFYRLLREIKRQNP